MVGFVTQGLESRVYGIFFGRKRVSVRQEASLVYVRGRKRDKTRARTLRSLCGTEGQRGSLSMLRFGWVLQWVGTEI